MDYVAQYDCPLGTITLTFDGDALTGLSFDSDDLTTPADSIPSLSSTCRWLDLYFKGQQPDFLPPIKLTGSDFQRHVWQALLDIPYGQTTTYGDIARRLGCRSAQAVGGAVGRNPIAIIVPCHRVIGADGSLTGYAYGLEIKEYLLQMENRHRLAVTW